MIRNKYHFFFIVIFLVLCFFIYSWASIFQIKHIFKSLTGNLSHDLAWRPGVQIILICLCLHSAYSFENANTRAITCKHNEIELEYCSIVFTCDWLRVFAVSNKCASASWLRVCMWVSVYACGLISIYRNIQLFCVCFHIASITIFNYSCFLRGGFQACPNWWRRHDEAKRRK